MTDTIRIRRANYDDAGLIADQRYLMFKDMDPESDATALQSMRDVAFVWTQKMLEQGVYLGWFLVDEATEQVVGGAGMWLLDWCPNPDDLIANHGYIINVYVIPAYRRRGLAKRLMTTILNYCQHHQITLVSLHSSPMGRTLYESLGFNATNEMQIELT
ncbi:MAG: GNAT family N-acetyltransferase [Aggregatilineales bacterium]